ncbi:hypothetical protein A8V01_18590 [Novosphingobium guangzhouense]|uniref:Glycosyltransferase 2-like domain-containing protein n=2 Tax=Novosphingobium guangzhouense TaxID=1850347 RepID=A0A2K2G143_9SPHN|nr:hypothetical protein A8V01_18590 [Novosphingobium guangzhouense]
MLQSDYPDVDVCRLAENTGAAGGFNLATRLAVASGADHIWLMDDDVIPEPQALEQLLAARDELHEQGFAPPFVLSLARAPNGMLTNVPDIDRTRNALDYANWPLQLGRGLAPVRRATFVSILIPKRVFDDHGYPLGSMFIWGEDSEFTLRVTREQPGYLVARSEVTHVRAQPGMLDIRREPPGPRLAWFRFLERNTIYWMLTHQSRRAAMRHARGRLYHALRLTARGKVGKATILCRGIVAGFFFRPDEARFSRSFDQTGIEFLSDDLRSRLTVATGAGPAPHSAEHPPEHPPAIMAEPSNVLQIGR